MTKKVLMRLLEDKKFKSIHEVLSQYNPVDLAELLSQLEEPQLVLVFRMLDKEKGAEVFSYMENDLRQTLIKSFTKQEIKDLLDSMYTDDAVDFLGDMPANVVTQLLENVDRDTRADINHLLKYSDDSAGSIMTVEFIELRRDMTVGQAFKLFRKYGLIAIPVLDSEDCIVGIVTFDDAIDVLTEETTEDMHRMAAIAETDESYLKTSVWKHAKNRILWLLVLMFSAAITGSIISRYESAFEVLPQLVAFIPMLMDTGGNCGTQSSTLIIRGLAVDELHFSDAFRILWKEFRVSLVVGTALAAANGLRILLMYRNPALACVVSVSLAGTITIAKLTGCMLPILAKKCRLDPAIMAAPFITTIVDTFSIMIYFNIATAVFHL